MTSCSWAYATVIAALLLVLAAVSFIAGYNWRDNRWIAPLAFFAGWALVLTAFASFFVLGFYGKGF